MDAPVPSRRHLHGLEAHPDSAGPGARIRRTGPKRFRFAKPPAGIILLLYACSFSCLQKPALDARSAGSHIPPKVCGLRRGRYGEIPLMFQKYEIIRNSARQTLSIREWAVIDKHLQNVRFSLLQPEDYALLHEETYESAAIEKAIRTGRGALVSALRTPFFYPNAETAAGIAESVAAMYAAPAENSARYYIPPQSSKEKGE
jgi:hypothetical protein